MDKVRGRAWSASFVMLSLVVSACGGADDVTTTTTETDAVTEAVEEAVTETEVAAATEEGDPLETLRAATVKISSQGSFTDPAVGALFNVAGVGTGFIIDPEGIVVTNNHVVTGAATLEVYLNGEDDPVNAQILGVSECTDLAVIDLEGDGYTALEFADDVDVIEGLDVYAAGFPLTNESTIEDVDYTLTRGIVSSTSADGETTWASVDSVLEHDARIRGGNSGGPLADEDGRIVGINYAGLDEADQNFAIGLDDALSVIEELREGQDVESIGINGQAVFDDAQGISGIWVASVESGSPASEAGIQGGDIITSLEGLVLATDGTMKDYCDVLRTRGPDAVYAVEVLRYETEEFLEGEINGAPLEQSFSFAQELEEPVGDDGIGTAAGYTEYMSVSDDTGAVTVDVPAEWVDVDGAPNENFGPSIYAAPDLQGFIETWDVPGVIVEVSSDLGSESIGTVLDEIGPAEQCVSQGRQPYEDPLYTGEFEVWTECGGTATSFITVAVVPADGGFLIRLAVQVVEDRDLEALDQILNTFVGAV